jgi:hypothetical protein
MVSMKSLKGRPAIIKGHPTKTNRPGSGYESSVVLSGGQ